VGLIAKNLLARAGIIRCAGQNYNTERMPAQPRNRLVKHVRVEPLKTGLRRTHCIKFSPPSCVCSKQNRCRRTTDNIDRVNPRLQNHTHTPGPAATAAQQLAPALAAGAARIHGHGEAVTAGCRSGILRRNICVGRKIYYYQDEQEQRRGGQSTKYTVHSLYIYIYIHPPEANTRTKCLARCGTARPFLGLTRKRTTN
jgi:hypothetical protein